MKEEWKEVVGFEEKYAASNTGKIKNIKTNKILSPNNNGKGYLSVQLGRSNRRYIHRLVLEAFKGWSSLEINHKDLDKANNCLYNLEYVTRQENQQHMIRGGKHNKAKITSELIVLIFNSSAAGIPVDRIACNYGISIASVRNVLTRKTWAWL